MSGDDAGAVTYRNAKAGQAPLSRNHCAAHAASSAWESSPSLFLMFALQAAAP
jgi:hypothetical protein